MFFWESEEGKNEFSDKKNNSSQLKKKGFKGMHLGKEKKKRPAPYYIFPVKTIKMTKKMYNTCCPQLFDCEQVEPWPKRDC